MTAIVKKSNKTAYSQRSTGKVTAQHWTRQPAAAISSPPSKPPRESIARHKPCANGHASRMAQSHRYGSMVDWHDKFRICAHFCREVRDEH